MSNNVKSPNICPIAILVPLLGLPSKYNDIIEKASFAALIPEIVTRNPLESPIPPKY